MKAVIMAGGRGTRLAPFTKVLPKPLIPLGDYPILEIIICQLRQAGVCEITLAVNYLAHLFEAYFGRGERLGVEINYSHETDPLGTAGPLRLVEGLDEPFLVLNADVLTDLDFRDLYEYHLMRDAMVTMAVHTKDVKIDFGVIELDDSARILRCREKPEFTYLINMGVYVVSPEAIDRIPYGRRYDFTQLIEDLLYDGRRVYGYVFGGDWMDLGRIDDFAEASKRYQHLGAVAEKRVALESYAGPARTVIVPQR
jgi:NDP-mannose synthase